MRLIDPARLQKISGKPTQPLGTVSTMVVSATLSGVTPIASCQIWPSMVAQRSASACAFSFFSISMLCYYSYSQSRTWIGLKTTMCLYKLPDDFEMFLSRICLMVAKTYKLFQDYSVLVLYSIQLRTDEPNYFFFQFHDGWIRQPFTHLTDAHDKAYISNNASFPYAT